MRHRCPHPLYHCPHCSEDIRRRMRDAFAHSFWIAVTGASALIAVGYAGVLRVLFGGRW